MLEKSKRYSFTDGIPKKALSSAYFTIRFQKGTADHIKCAVVVSKKVDTRATQRNKIKRNVMRIVQELFEERAIEVVFYMKRAVYSLSYEELKKEVSLAFQRINIL